MWRGRFLRISVLFSKVSASLSDGLRRMAADSNEPGMRTTVAGRLRATAGLLSRRPRKIPPATSRTPERTVMWRQKPKATPPIITTQPSDSADDQTAPAAGSSEPASSRIVEGVTLRGKISSSEDLHVDGDLEGTVELPDHTLLVGPNGHVRAEVTARSIILRGNLEGKAHARERMEIRKGGSLTGEMETEKIVIEDGSMFRGIVKMLQPEAEEKKPTPPPADDPPAADASRDTRPGASLDRPGGEQDKQAG